MRRPSAPKHFPRILGVVSDNSASSYYRVQLPLAALHECGYPVGWGNIEELHDRVVDRYDVILLSRTGTGDPAAIREVFQSFRRQGKVVWLDYDDDVLNIPEHNIGRHDQVDGIVAAMDEAHGLVVTGTALAAALRPYARHIAVLPNYVNPRNWPIVQYPKERLIVGLTGSASHVKDWEIVAEPMRRIMHRFPVDFLVAGFVPDYLRELATITHDWMPLHQYPYVVNQIDIGLCPLVDDHFNRCKTPLKALELGLAGAAVVASPTQYLSVVKGKGTIAQTENQWEQAIEKYIVNDAKRLHAGQALRDYVEHRWNVWRYVETIADVYRDLYRRSITPLGQRASAA